MSTQDEAPITYIDADGTPIPAPRDLNADQGGEGEHPPMFVHLSGAGTTSAAELLEPAWRTTAAWAAVVFVAGALMVALSSGLAAIVLWPLGIFAMIAAGGALWVMMTARRLMSGDSASRP